MRANSSDLADSGPPASSVRDWCKRASTDACHCRSTGEVRMYRMAAARASRAARADPVSDHGLAVLVMTSGPA